MASLRDAVVLPGPVSPMDLVGTMANVVLEYELSRRLPTARLMTARASDPRAEGLGARIVWGSAEVETLDEVAVQVTPVQLIGALPRAVPRPAVRFAAWELRARGELPPPGDPMAAVVLTDPSTTVSSIVEDFSEPGAVVVWHGARRRSDIDGAYRVRADATLHDLLVVINEADRVVTDTPELVLVCAAYRRDVTFVGSSGALVSLPVRTDGGVTVRDHRAWARLIDAVDDELDRVAARLGSRLTESSVVDLTPSDAYLADLESAVRAQTAQLADQRLLFGEYLDASERGAAAREDELRRRLEDARAAGASLQAELDRMLATKVFRYTAALRRAYAAARSRRS